VMPMEAESPKPRKSMAKAGTKHRPKPKRKVVANAK
jgi:hypothetical protein